MDEVHWIYKHLRQDFVFCDRIETEIGRDEQLNDIRNQHNRRQSCYRLLKYRIQ